MLASKRMHLTKKRTTHDVQQNKSDEEKNASDKRKNTSARRKNKSDSWSDVIDEQMKVSAGKSDTIDEC